MIKDKILNEVTFILLVFYFTYKDNFLITFAWNDKPIFLSWASKSKSVITLHEMGGRRRLDLKWRVWNDSGPRYSVYQLVDTCLTVRLSHTSLVWLSHIDEYYLTVATNRTRAKSPGPWLWVSACGSSNTAVRYLCLYLLWNHQIK